MNPCKSMDADLYLKSKREDVGGGSIKLIYPREVKVTMEFHAQSMLSLGKQMSPINRRFMHFIIFSC